MKTQGWLVDSVIPLASLGEQEVMELTADFHANLSTNLDGRDRLHLRERLRGRCAK